jgi:hypothetical protein
VREEASQFSGFIDVVGHLDKHQDNLIGYSILYSGPATVRAQSRKLKTEVVGGGGGADMSFLSGGERRGFAHWVL